MLTTNATTHGIFVRRGKPAHAVARNGGFTLIEVLIALLLGALVIGGVATVFLSSQQTYLRLSDYNNAQEAFRYASHTITRVTRGAAAIAPSGENSLVVELRPDGGGTNRNCLGQPITGQEFNRFCISNDNLVCEVSNNVIPPGSQCPDGAVLVQGVDTLDFEYATGGFDEYMENYLGAGATDWATASGVRVTAGMLGIADEFQVTFTASVRAMLIPDEVVVRPGG